MLTGRDPGELGIYGFRSRRDRSYDAPALNDAGSVNAPALWDLLGSEGFESIVVGNPYTWPTSLARDIERWVGEYAFDCAAHRSGDRERIRREVWQMTERRFRVIRELIRSRPWQLCFAHEIGLDRLQHAFWGALDAPDDPDRDVLLDYHRLLDAEIGETLELLPEETVVWIVSDHGARSLEGSFCINEWLVDEGYLRLRPGACGGERPVAPTPEDVDWSRTRAWADGGYCGRVYLNVRDREPEGILGAEAARAAREELREKLEALPGPAGEPLGTAVHLPEEVYVRTSGVAPDLLVYPGDLALRCAASVGHTTPGRTRPTTPGRGSSCAATRSGRAADGSRERTCSTSRRRSSSAWVRRSRAGCTGARSRDGG
jgi:predicted AlkP superfamily phosphohydrolase/phosphomutase